MKEVLSRGGGLGKKSQEDRGCHLGLEKEAKGSTVCEAATRLEHPLSTSLVLSHYQLDSLE